MGRSDPLSWLPPLVVGGVLGAVVAGVLLSPTNSGDASAASVADPGASPSSSVRQPSIAPSTASTPSTLAPLTPTPPAPAQEGRRASSQVERFEPAALVLPNAERAEVVPVATVDGELQVPKHVDHLGWWDGSAWLGDPFGATVIAGHVDSATEGLGFFAQLLDIRAGQRITLLGERGQRQTYEVTSVRAIPQNALADSRTLDQTGNHRVVLITCTGAYTPGKGYASNLVVTAKQLDAQK